MNSEIQYLKHEITVEERNAVIFTGEVFNLQTKEIDTVTQVSFSPRLLKLRERLDKALDLLKEENRKPLVHIPDPKFKPVRVGNMFFKKRDLVVEREVDIEWERIKYRDNRYYERCKGI